MFYNLFPFWLTMGIILLKVVFADINILFFTKVYIFPFYISLHYSFHKHIQQNVYELRNLLVQNVFQTA